MKITKERLKQIIKEELGETAAPPNKPFNPAGIDDSYQVSWDAHLDAMRRIFLDIGMDVIDHYQEKPEEFGILTKEDARKEIIEVLQATVDNFVNDDLPGELGLGEFLDDEFDDDPHTNTAEDGREEVIMESFLQEEFGQEEFDEDSFEYNVGDLVEVQISDDGYETNVERLDNEVEFNPTHGYSTSEKFLAKVIKVSQREYED